MRPSLKLRKLTRDDEKAFYRARSRAHESDPNLTPYYDPDQSFEDYLLGLSEKEDGIGLPPDHVRGIVLFGFVDGHIVGRLSLRFELTDFLSRVGGHIGYVVLPEFRRRGYATEMLRQGLQVAKRRGMKRVLLTCDDGNSGSQKTIEACGGVLEGLYQEKENDHPVRRYWIQVGQRTG